MRKFLAKVLLLSFVVISVIYLRFVISTGIPPVIPLWLNLSQSAIETCIFVYGVIKLGQYCNE